MTLGAGTTHTGNRGLQIEEPLLFEQGRSEEHTSELQSQA